MCAKICYDGRQDYEEGWRTGDPGKLKGAETGKEDEGGEGIEEGRGDDVGEWRRVEDW